MSGVIMQHETEAETQFTSQDSQLSNPPAGQAKSWRKHWLVVGITALIVVGLLVSGIVSRVRLRATLRTEAVQTAVTPVSVVQPKRTAPDQEIILPADVEPFINSPIYAQATGYLKQWYFDIGAHVKEGDLLAVIEDPGLDQQVSQSLSNLNTAKANLALAEITRNRYQGLIKTNAVSQQDVDNAVGSYNANQAIVEADEANVKQLQALQSFEKVYAPFDGVITARNTDIGDLINSGNSGNSGTVRTDLFHIAQTSKLRVYVNVPEEYSQGVKAGMTANLALAEFPGRTFQGKLVRTAEAINVTTRTLLIEIDVDNPTGTLFTGSYAEVHLKLPGQTSAYLIPDNTLIFRSEGLQVAVVKDGKVTLTNVTAGHDLGNSIEIVAGLKADDQVVINPPDSIVSGQQVQIVQASLPGDSK
jgi:RND family efflux transporter MFP subunit